MKNVIFAGTRQNPEDIMKVANDIAEMINKTNNIDYIKPDEHGDLTILEDKIFLQVGGGNSTSGKYFDVILFYGKEEATIQSFDSADYEAFIQQVVAQVNEVFNKQIKIITYSIRRKCYGRKWLRLNQSGEWELYSSFELNGFFSRLFIHKTYENVDNYDFTH